MPGLTSDECATFLSEPGHLLRLGTIGLDGLPRVVPIWFVHEDDRLWFTPRARSAWLDELRANAGVCATIDESVGLMRKVVVRGVARLDHDVGDDDEWRDRYRRITMRYVPTEFGERYLSDTHDEPRALWSVGLSDEAADVSTWRMPGSGENSLAVWAPRYYHDDRSSEG